jgi:hypothetical protein
MPPCRIDTTLVSANNGPRPILQWKLGAPAWKYHPDRYATRLLATREEMNLTLDEYQDSPENFSKILCGTDLKPFAMI